MSSTTLSRDELAKIASDVGFKGNDVEIAVAVALAESGGNRLAHNQNAATGDDSYGLWQINMIGKLGPDRRKAFNIKSNDALFIPAINGHAAKKIHASQGWEGWTTYTNGKYKQHYKGSGTSLSSKVALGAGALGPAGSAIAGAAVGAEGIGTAAEAAKEAVANANPLARIPESINAFTRSIFKAFANVQGISIALAFIVLGIIILLRSPIAKVLPAGKAAKVVKGVVS